MKHLFRTFPVLLPVLIALVFATGCKENTLINSKVSPSDNAIGIFDTTLSVVTHSFFEDTVVTSTHYSGIAVYQGIGTYTDPFFGTMTSSTYFNLIPSDFTPLIDTLVDSAILILPYSGFTYGDTLNTNETQTYQVFYMQDTLDYNSTYFSYSMKPIDVVHPLSAPVTVNVFHIRDSADTYTQVQNEPGLRIKLNLATLKQHLLPALNTAASTQDFLNAFNGICVQVADTRTPHTAIPYFRLDGSGTYDEAGVLVYHHNAGDPATVLATPYYYDIDYCAHFNSVTKSYSRYPVNNLFRSTQANDQVIALQNRPGATIDVIIPGIKSLPAGIINKAELQLTMLPGYNNYIYSVGGDSILFAPQRLNPTGVGINNYPVGVSNGLLYNIADAYPIYSSTPLNVIDGTLHQFVKNGITYNTFTVDLPREVMAAISAKNDTIHLQIDGTQNFYGAFHLVAGGGNYPDPNYQAKLFVVYSKLKN